MKALKWLDNYLEEAILVLLLTAIAVVMGMQVFSRYFLSYPLSWTEELSQYMFVWATFLSISYCVKKRRSIKIEQFLMVLPHRGQAVLRLLRHTLVFVFCLIMIPYSLTFVGQAVDSQATSAALHIPLYFIQSAPLVGFVLLAIRVAQAWLREAKNTVKGGQA